MSNVYSGGGSPPGTANVVARGIELVQVQADGSAERKTYSGLNLNSIGSLVSCPERSHFHCEVLAAGTHRQEKRRPSNDNQGGN
jgi:hypothetical protein